MRHGANARLFLLMLGVSGCGSPREADEARPLPPSDPEPVNALAGEARLDVGGGAAPKPKPKPKPLSDVKPGLRRISESARPGLIEFGDALEGDGALWVGQLGGNGGRDVVLFVPPRSDPKADFDLVVHFHGTYSENIAREQPGVPKKAWVGWNRLQQTIDALSELQERSANNVALLYPISAGKRMEPSRKGWSNKMYDRMWMTPVVGDARYIDDFDAMVDQALGVLDAELGVPRARVLPKVLAEGHSAGGIALRNVAAAGTQRVREYVFLDASFQDWADGCFAAVREQNKDALVSLVITQGGIADPFGKRDPWCTRLEDAARTWVEAEGVCKGHAEQRSSTYAGTCAAHEADAKAWPDYEAWCEGMKNDMAEEPGVFVFRTKVPHGKQPRHFSGGLELPAARLSSP